MGGYDLYGNYYHREIDAMNAEMAQCANIDRNINSKQTKNLELHITELENRLQKLEEQCNKLKK